MSPPSPSTRPPQMAPTSASMHPAWLTLALFAATFLAYLPALSGEYLWDDAGHVTRPDLRSFAGLVRIWFEPGATQQYYPLLHSAFWLEHQLWGDSPLGYHLVNILFHATGACLFAAVLRKLAVPGAWLAAFLFALHPVAVESVAWITEQKNTLSLVCYLGAALVWLRRSASHDGKVIPFDSTYWIATALFCAALLSKSVTATLPAALLVIAWWKRGTIDWRREVTPLIPWFVLAALAGAMTAWMERNYIGAQGDAFSLSLGERLLVAGRAQWFYLGKLLWPAELVFIYPRWELGPSDAAQWIFPLGAAALIVALWSGRRRTRAPLTVALLFVGTLFPALGFINVYPFLFSFVADHFQYHASLAIFAGCAAGLTLAIQHRSPIASRASVGVLLTVLGALTWAQCHEYRDLFSLYGATIQRNPKAWLAHNNLGVALVDAGRAGEAPPHFEAALTLRPEYAEAENNFGDALNRLGRASDAVPHLERALRLRPGYAEAHNNLGAAFMAVGKSAEGIAQFTEASRLNPRYAVARFNLGLALASSGRPADAIAHFSAAVRLQPDYADAELNWAMALTLTDRPAEAMPHYEAALKLKPDSAFAHFTYGRALLRAGRYDYAISHFQQALQLNPAMAEAHQQLAVALGQSGRSEEATQHLLEARRLRPGAF